MGYLIYLIRSLDIAYYLTGIMLGIGCWIVLGRLDWKQRLAASLLITYVFLVLSVTVLARRPYNEFRIKPPFWSYIEILHGNPKSYAYATEIVLNMLMLVPVGFLLPVLGRKNVILYGFLCSLCIEVFQLVTKRGYFEVNDLLHNTIGVVAGYWLYKLLVWTAGKIKK